MPASWSGMQKAPGPIMASRRTAMAPNWRVGSWRAEARREVLEAGKRETDPNRFVHMAPSET